MLCKRYRKKNRMRISIFAFLAAEYYTSKPDGCTCKERLWAEEKETLVPWKGARRMRLKSHVSPLPPGTGE